MGEGLRNLTFLVWALCAVNAQAKSMNTEAAIAEEKATTAPTIVYGAAKKANGKTDAFVVEQPDGAVNPLGNPLPDLDVRDGETTEDGQSEVPSVSIDKGIPSVSAETKELPSNDLGKDFQNTLMEANGMVYDVQAYPVKDLNAIGNSANPETIYSPNVNP